MKIAQEKPKNTWGGCVTALIDIEDYLSLTAKMMDCVETTDDEVVVIFNFKKVDEEYRKYVLYDFLQRLYADMEGVITFEQDR